MTPKQPGPRAQGKESERRPVMAIILALGWRRQGPKWDGRAVLHLEGDVNVACVAGRRLRFSERTPAPSQEPH